MTAPVLDVAGLSIDYRLRDGFARVIDDVSFAIAPGEAYGLVGESGCGKSTLAMAIMRYLPRNARIAQGCIRFSDLDLYSLRRGELRRLRGDRIATVYQDPASALTPTMIVGEQIAEIFKLHRGMSRRDAFDAALRMLEVVQVGSAQRVAHSYPHQISGGQQQRVMLAMALATDPDLLILDEPTTGLDATIEAQVLDLIDSLRAKFNAAILFISHDLGIVARLCERVGVLYAGELVEEARTSELFRKPAHPYTSALLACVPRRHMRKDVAPLRPIAGSLPPLGHDLVGCSFADRCAYVTAECRERPPTVRETGEMRWARCVHPLESESEPLRITTEDLRPNTGRASLLQAMHLRKRFRAGSHVVRAIDDATLEIGEGEIVGVVGESGSGKSTLAKLLVGLVAADDGSITLKGMHLAPIVEQRPAEYRRLIQLIFQNPDGALNPRRTVRTILRRATRCLSSLRSIREIDERVRSIAASVRLDERHLDMRAVGLSGGLKQRVAIACAFAGSPAVVVCDEAASALDVSVQAAILELLVNLSRTEKVSYVFISHDLQVVRYLSDRIYVMYNGNVIETGTADDVFRPPHHPYTEVLASAEMLLDDDSRTRIHFSMDANAAGSSTGCPFSCRCPRSMGQVCRDVEPPLWTTNATHTYRCHIPPDELKSLQTSEKLAVPTVVQP